MNSLSDYIFMDHGVMLFYVQILIIGSIRLPHPGAVRSLYANSDMSSKPGINMHSMEILKKKAAEKRGHGEKLLCTVIFDEISIRKNVQ